MKIKDNASDKLIEILIYFIIIFSVWAFGTTENWSIWVVNITSYVLGILLCLKSYISYAKYRNKFIYTKKQQTILKISLYSAFLLLLYIFTSATNSRAQFDASTKIYSYSETYIKYLPHSYDSNLTWNLFSQYLAYIIIFWAVISWLTDRGNYNRLRKLIFVISINAGLLAMIGLFQKYLYTVPSNKLLFLIEPSFNNHHSYQFSSFAYRTNAASYFNMIWPIALGYYIYSNQYNLNRVIGNNANIILLPITFILATSSFLTSSRAGGLIMIMLMLLIFVYSIYRYRYLRETNTTINITLLLILGISLYLGWSPFSKRINNFVNDKMSNRIEIYDKTMTMIDNYVLSNNSPAPYGSGPGTFSTVYYFEMTDDNKFWHLWAHNDYLEFLLTFGIPGFLLILTIYITIFYATFNKELTMFKFNLYLSLLSIIIVAMFDFPFQVQSIYIMFVIILAILLYISSNISILNKQCNKQ